MADLVTITFDLRAMQLEQMTQQQMIGVPPIPLDNMAQQQMMGQMEIGE